MSEDKKPYLIINEEYDEIKINIKHTKPYIKLQQENQQLKDMFEDSKTFSKQFLYKHNKNLLEANKRLLQQRDKYKEIIEEVREYVTNHSLYEEEYDYDYEENSYLSGIDDETATKDILQILDKAKENK